MVSYKTYYITVAIIVIFSICFFLFSLSKNNKKIRNSGLSLNIYYNMIDLLKSMYDQIEKIKEINILLQKNAEIESSVINTNGNYLSYDFLLTLKENYVNKLLIDDCLFCDIYNSVSKQLSQGIQSVIHKNIESIHIFIKENKMI